MTTDILRDFLTTALTRRAAIANCYRPGDARVLCFSNSLYVAIVEGRPQATHFEHADVWYGGAKVPQVFNGAHVEAKPKRYLTAKREAIVAIDDAILTFQRALASAEARNDSPEPGHVWESA